jgi:ABC-type multidrug transport system ATPase subunit
MSIASLTSRREASTDPILEIRNLSFRYLRSTERQPLLDQINLTVRPGDRWGLIGGNGTGKSTLLKLIIGMLRPTAGTLSLCGRTPTWNQHFPAVSYIGNPSRSAGDAGLPPDLRVGALLDAHRDLFCHSNWTYPYGCEIGKRLDLHLSVWRRKRICELSDGWRQRVMFLLALAKAPALLVADEAMVTLDRDHRAPLLDVVRSLADKIGMALLWVTHSPIEIYRLRLRVLCLQSGQLRTLPSPRWTCRITSERSEPPLIATGNPLDPNSDPGSCRESVELSVLPELLAELAGGSDGGAVRALLEFPESGDEPDG